MKGHNPNADRAVMAARIASLFALAIGVSVLAGWFLDIPRLTRLLYAGPTVKTNAGVALTSGALANLLSIARRDRLESSTPARLLAAVPLILGILTLSEHLVGWNLRIDQLLAIEAPGALATASPNRMGPPASTTFFLIGSALLLADSARPRLRSLSQLLASAACVVAILPVTGYAYGVSELYAISQYTGISLTTAVALLLLASAILAAHPEEGFASLLCRRDEVGNLARRLVPTVVLLPLGVGWLLAKLGEAGVIDGPFAVSVMAVVLVLGLTSLIWRTGTQLGRALDERLAAEEALSRSEQTLREADQQKTKFLATLSHELRNPLAPIRFALELLNGPPAAADRARKTIARQTQHLVRLIDDLLDLTRITRNKLHLREETVELRRLVDDAVDAVSPELTRMNHRLDVRLPERAVWLHADPDRVVQMLTNLLSNAARYTDTGGAIELHADVEDADVVMSVRDNGMGIDAPDLARVFEMFVQVGDTQHGGLGIGLALVKGLAELHGGRADASSDGRGRGSEFRIRLPRVCTPSPAVPSLPLRRGSASPGSRILVVDDNRDAADTLRDLLIERGHVVQVAYDGQEALLFAASFKPVVALLDIGMPGLSGHELAARLRQAPETATIMLIAITGWGQEEDRRRALASGFDAHVTKPADPEAIIGLLEARAGVTE